ncbi:uncharacterized protein LOC125671611 isoform X2 [Ostrea edulis]|uniref:uncharacterized protein LOC125671611 isoform X2 n=2 Tax=Ostrea edulis TaxID=37623 RepID=UPI0020940A09|nr:uncharacterized protein LOC125671611 isoform X2 [Ostrea edulis]
MFMEWIWEILYYIGFYRRAKLMIIGFDNAGKSTLLSLLKHGKLVQHSPSLHPALENITLDGIGFTVYDLAGHRIGKKILSKHLSTIINAAVYVIDATDKERILEVKAELKEILACEIPPDIPVAILGNKTDKSGCYGMEELIQVLDLQQELMSNQENNKSDRQCKLFMTSMVNGQGYDDAVRWLTKYIK